MLLEPTLARLRELRLTGMAEALEEQQAVPDILGLSFEDRLGLLVDREGTLPVEIVHDGPRIAALPHSHRSGPFTTDPSHQPEALEKDLEWTPPVDREDRTPHGDRGPPDHRDQSSPPTGPKIFAPPKTEDGAAVDRGL